MAFNLDDMRPLKHVQPGQLVLSMKEMNLLIDEYNWLIEEAKAQREHANTMERARDLAVADNQLVQESRRW